MATTFSPRSIENVNDIQELKALVGNIERFGLYAREVLKLRELQIRTLPHTKELRDVEDAALALPSTITWN
jgi:hypothetical protein